MQNFCFTLADIVLGLFSAAGWPPPQLVTSLTQHKAMALVKFVYYLLELPPRDSGTPLLLGEQWSKGVFAEDTPAEYLLSTPKHGL